MTVSCCEKRHVINRNRVNVLMNGNLLSKAVRSKKNVTKCIVKCSGLFAHTQQTYFMLSSKAEESNNYHLLLVKAHISLLLHHHFISFKFPQLKTSQSQYNVKNRSCLQVSELQAAVARKKTRQNNFGSRKTFPNLH